MGTASFDYTEVEVINDSGERVFTGLFRETGKPYFALYVANGENLKSETVIRAAQAADNSRGIDTFIAGLSKAGIQAKINLCKGYAWPPRLAGNSHGVYVREHSDWVCIS